MRFLAMLAGAVLALTAAGCGGNQATGGPAVIGSVHGSITLDGGPRGAPPHVTAAGTVIATRGGRPVARQSVAEGQSFAFRLRPGTYGLSVKDLPCADLTVTVAAGTDQAAVLACSIK